jgi:peptide subunit release factor RF-3
VVVCVEQKGVDELLEEGAVQLLYERGDEGQQNPILAAVGQLQFEVVQYRLKEVRPFVWKDTLTALTWT